MVTEREAEILGKIILFCTICLYCVDVGLVCNIRDIHTCYPFSMAMCNKTEK